ncbi:MAG TPA: hypothetical protein V6C58_24090, partial [Allocoleopsis sp.]
MVLWYNPPKNESVPYGTIGSKEGYKDCVSCFRFDKAKIMIDNDNLIHFVMVLSDIPNDVKQYGLGANQLPDLKGKIALLSFHSKEYEKTARNDKGELTQIKVEPNLLEQLIFKLLLDYD